MEDEIVASHVVKFVVGQSRPFREKWKESEASIPAGMFLSIRLLDLHACRGVLRLSPT